MLRDQLIAEINELKDSDALAIWAHRHLAAKNTLTTEDAGSVEAVYQGVLERLDLGPIAEVAASVLAESKLGQTSEPLEVQLVKPISKAVRKRDKAHLAFVSAQPCLVCKRSPCDAHHSNLPSRERWDARSATSSPYRCAERIIKNSITTATKLHGGPIYRSHR